jgi:hypothetical protein
VGYDRLGDRREPGDLPSIAVSARAVGLQRAAVPIVAVALVVAPALVRFRRGASAEGV